MSHLEGKLIAALIVLKLRSALMMAKTSARLLLRPNSVTILSLIPSFANRRISIGSHARRRRHDHLSSTHTLLLSNASGVVVTAAPSVITTEANINNDIAPSALSSSSVNVNVPNLASDPILPTPNEEEERSQQEKKSPQSIIKRTHSSTSTTDNDIDDSKTTHDQVPNSDSYYDGMNEALQQFDLPISKKYPSRCVPWLAQWTLWIDDPWSTTTLHLVHTGGVLDNRPRGPSPTHPLVCRRLADHSRALPTRFVKNGSSHGDISILHALCARGAIDMIRALLQRSEFASMVNKEYSASRWAKPFTPWYIAALQGRTELCHILQRAGALPVELNEDTLRICAAIRNNLPPFRVMPMMHYPDLKLDLKSCDNIPQGTHSKVYRGRLPEEYWCRDVAVKVIPWSSPGITEARFAREAALNVYHGGHAEGIYVDVEGSQFMLVSEFIEQGTLEAFIHNTARPIRNVVAQVCQAMTGTSPSEEEMMFVCLLANPIASEIVFQLHQMHRNGTWHRDLRLDNILMPARGKPQISDFGSAVRVDTQGVLLDPSDHYYYCVTPPEVIEGKHYSDRADIWAVGLILLALWTGKKPFTDMAVQEVATLVKGPGLIDHLLSGRCPDQWADLIRDCCHPNPISRPTCEQLAQKLIEMEEQFLASCSSRATINDALADLRAQFFPRASGTFTYV